MKYGRPHISNSFFNFTREPPIYPWSEINLKRSSVNTPNSSLFKHSKVSYLEYYAWPLRNYSNLSRTTRLVNFHHWLPSTTTESRWSSTTKTSERRDCWSSRSTPRSTTCPCWSRPSTRSTTSSPNPRTTTPPNAISRSTMNPGSKYVNVASNFRRREKEWRINAKITTHGARRMRSRSRWLGRIISGRVRPAVRLHVMNRIEIMSRSIYTMNEKWFLPNNNRLNNILIIYCWTFAIGYVSNPWKIGLNLDKKWKQIHQKTLHS